MDNIVSIHQLANEIAKAVSEYTEDVSEAIAKKTDEVADEVLIVYGKDTKSIERDIDLSGVCTALHGRGKDNLNVLVTDSSALALWGRSGGTRHRYGLYENTEQDDEEVLRDETYADLQTRNTPTATYTMKVVDLETIEGSEDEKTRMGDTVRGIDRAFNPPLLVSARVIEMTRSLSNSADTEVVLGTYKPSIIEDLAKQKKQIADTVADVETVKTVTDSVTNGDLTAEIIKLGKTNGLGTCQIDTRGDGLRIQSHPAGYYTKIRDDGGLEFYANDVCYAWIKSEGTTNLSSSGGGGGVISNEPKFAALSSCRLDAFFPDVCMQTLTKISLKNGNCAMFMRPDDRSVPTEAIAAQNLIVIGGPTANHPNEVLLSGHDKYATAEAVAKYLG